MQPSLQHARPTLFGHQSQINKEVDPETHWKAQSIALHIQLTFYDLLKRCREHKSWGGLYYLLVCLFCRWDACIRAGLASDVCSRIFQLNCMSPLNKWKSFGERRAVSQTKCFTWRTSGEYWYLCVQYITKQLGGVQLGCFWPVVAGFDSFVVREWVL